MKNMFIFFVLICSLNSNYVDKNKIFSDDDPYSIEIYSGNNQVADKDGNLPEPIKVLVKDKLGRPAEYAVVIFEVQGSDGGKVTKIEASTNEQGIAQTTWKIGITTKETKKLKVTALTLEGTALINSPLYFEAKLADEKFGTFKDPRDGYVYKTVKIGTQTWFAENLRYASTQSFCNQCETYGRLYIWNDALTVCPTGWHLPTDAEWTTLTTYLGGESVAGGKMKETGTTHWISPNTGATNESGFAALPGNRSYGDGTFYYVGYSGFFWSSTASGASDAWRCRLLYNNAASGRYAFDMRIGLSVRCVRD